MRLPSNHWIFEPRWITWGQELTVKVAMAKTAVSVSADGGPEKVHPVPDKVKKRRKSCPPCGAGGHRREYNRHQRGEKQEETEIRW